MLNFQTKPCEINHCKPSKKCQPFFFFLFLLHNLENVHSIETTRHRSRGADDTPCTCFELSYFFLILSLTLTRQERRFQVNPAPPITTPLVRPLLDFQVLRANTQLLKQQSKICQCVLLPRILLSLYSFSTHTFQNRHFKTNKQK